MDVREGVVMSPSGGTFELVGRVDSYVVGTSKAGNRYGKAIVTDGGGRRFDVVVFDADAIAAITQGMECAIRGELRPRRTPNGMMVVDLIAKSVHPPVQEEPQAEGEEDPFA